MRYSVIATTAALAWFAAAPAFAQSTSTTVTTPAPGAAVTTTSPTATGAISIAPEKRTVIKQRFTTAQPVQLQERVTVGWTVPSSVQLVEVPETVVTEVPAVRGFRFFRWNDDVVLVDPSTRRVVQIID